MASTPQGSSALILTQSKGLRLLTLLLFYFTQGFPIGLFYTASPAGWGPTVPALRRLSG